MDNISSTIVPSEIFKSLLLLSSNNYYSEISDVKHIGEAFRMIETTATESAQVATKIEFDLVPYEFCRFSGVLSFWDNPEEDIYSFEDGQPI
ncbi:hypothetical protein KA005_11675 [bacterium]|nr:hypothetical protein [bacterium]